MLVVNQLGEGEMLVSRIRTLDLLLQTPLVSLNAPTELPTWDEDLSKYKMKV